MQKLCSELRTDGGTQLRCETDEETVDEYEEDIKAGCTFPPVVAFWDGLYLWLAGGFHRLAAHIKAGCKYIEVEIREGTLRDAILFAASDNQKHGLRRKRKDKRKAVLTLLQDAEWGMWSANRIAKACGVSHTLVDTVKWELSCSNCKIDSGTVRARRGDSDYDMRPPKRKPKLSDLSPDEQVAAINADEYPSLLANARDEAEGYLVESITAMRPFPELAQVLETVDGARQTLVDLGAEDEGDGE